MTRPRTTLVSLAETPWYHVVSRCVRRAYLCGEDAWSGQSYEHRRGWIVERVKQLAGVFAIDVAAYAVMSNHYHLVVRVDVERTRDWNRDEILRRWTALFDGPLVVRQYLAGDGQEERDAPDAALDEWAEVYRGRLCDLSWFMRVLNESIARQANAEDGVTGRFWEGRFRSQALLGEEAVLAAMVYVDLNPIRAQMAGTPEESDFTSVAERIAQLRETAAPPESSPRPAANRATTGASSRRVDACPNPALALHDESRLASLPRNPLMPFDATARLATAIPFAFDDYLELVEMTGRCSRPDKRGAIAETTPRLLQRLQLQPEQFMMCAIDLMKRFGQAVGTPAHLTQLSVARQVKYLRGVGAARQWRRRAAA